MADLLDSNSIFFTAFEPKTQNRFIMYIDGIPAFLIKGISRPKISMPVVTLNHMNIQRKIKGLATWEDISITLYDAVVPSAAQACMEWIRLAHESVTGRDGYADFYKKDITINVLGPVGDKVEEWTLKGAFPTSFDGGTMDWGNGEPLNVTLNIAYDFAVLQY